MAFWIKGHDDIKDNNRKNGHGRMVSYGADTEADIALLPQFDGQNQGSTCLVLKSGLISGKPMKFELGTDPSTGINGWVRL